MKEAELYKPIRAWFEADGYAGDGEVGGIDLYLEKDGLSTAVELKKTLDFKAIRQAALDQRSCDLVWIGIFRPANLFSREMKEKLYLLKRLGIGLICVSPRTGKAEAVNEPIVSELTVFQQRNRKRTEALKKEFRNRSVKNNPGGVRGTKLMTAYREEALRAADTLRLLGGQGTCGRIREMTGNPEVTGILYRNVYGWFENVTRGEYRITEDGLQALEEYGETVRLLREKKKNGPEGSEL